MLTLMYIFRNKNEVEIKNTTQKHVEARIESILEVVDDHCKFLERHYDIPKKWDEHKGLGDIDKKFNYLNDNEKLLIHGKMHKVKSASEVSFETYDNKRLRMTDKIQTLDMLQSP